VWLLLRNKRDPANAPKNNGALHGAYAPTRVHRWIFETCGKLNCHLERIVPRFGTTTRVRLVRRTMICVSVAGTHAVARIPTRVACTRRPFEPMNATLDAARQPAALAGFVSRRVKPHALRHTEQSIWMDQARRHGRALGDRRTPRRWAMTPSSEYIPAEGEAFRQAYVPRRCVLPLSSLVYDFSCQLPKRRH